MTDTTTPAPEPAELAQLREAIREAHQVLKDMRAERRALTALADGLTARVDQRIAEQLEAGLAELGKVTSEQMRVSVAHVEASFERLASLYLGTDPALRRAGKPPLEQALRAYVARRDSGGIPPG